MEEDLASMHSFGQSTALSVQSEGTRSETGDKLQRGKIALYSLFAFTNNWKRNRVDHIVRIVELMQLFAFPFSRFIHVWGKADTYFFFYFENLFLFGSYYIGEPWIFIPFALTLTSLIAIFIIGTYSIIALQKGEELKGKFPMLLQVMIKLFPVLYSPMIGVLASQVCAWDPETHFRSTESGFCFKAEHTAESTLGLTAICITVIYGAIFSVFSFHWCPQKKSWISTTSPRIFIIMYALKTAFVLERLFLFDLNSTIQLAVFSSTVILGYFVLSCYIFLYFPFHKFVTNVVYECVFAFSFVISCIRVLSTEKKDSFISLYVLVGLSAPITASIILLLRRRWKAITSLTVKFLHLYKSLSDDLLKSEQIFNREVDVEIACRFDYFNEESKESDTISIIFQFAEEKYLGSQLIRVAHCVYLASKSADHNLLPVIIRRATRNSIPLDYAFIIYCIEQKRREAISKKDGGSSEISYKLREVAACQEQCKKWIKAFWNNLAREEELASLPDIVAMIEKYEKKCEHIYRKLMTRFPKSTRVLRAYSIFLEEIKNDLESAHRAIQTADEIEEDRSKNHRPKVIKKKKIVPTLTPSKVRVVVVEPENSRPTPMKDTLVIDMKSVSRNNSEEVGSVPQSARSASQYEPTTWTKEKRQTMLRTKKYSEAIRNSRSSALRKLKFSIRLTMVILFVDLIIVYSSTRIVIDTYKESIEHIEQTGRMRFFSVTVIFFVIKIIIKLPNFGRSLELNAKKGDLATYGIIIQNITTALTTMENQFKYINSINKNYAILDKLFKEEVWNMQQFVVLDANTSYREQSSVNIMHEFSLNFFLTFSSEFTKAFFQSVRIVLNSPPSQFTSPPRSAAFQFLLDNGPITLLNAYNDTVSQISSLNQRDANLLLVLLSSIFPISVVTLFLSTLFIFAPSVRKIIQERNQALQLFLAIPKSTIILIHENLSGKEKKEEDVREEDEEEVNDFALENTQASIPILKQLLFRYSLSLVITFIIIFTFLLIGLLFLNKNHTFGSTVNSAAFRRALASKVRFFSRELAIGDKNTWNDTNIVRDLLESSADELRKEYQQFKYGGEEFPGMMNNADQSVFFNDIDCTFPPSYNTSVGACKGSDALQFQYLRNVDLLLGAYNKSLPLDPSNDYVKNIIFISDQLFKIFFSSVDKVKSHMQNEFSKFIRNIGIIFGVSVPILLFSFLILTPIENNIKMENSRTMKMLLMIPVDVIDQVPAVRDYLETGSQANIQKKWKLTLEEVVSRNKTIIDGSVDAIVAINAAGIVELFNPAAEALWGWKSSEIIGHNVSALMPDRTAMLHDHYLKARIATGRATIPRTRELIAKTKDGREVPITLSLSEAQVGGKIFFAGFCRDVTAVKQYQEELMHQKEVSENILKSIFPNQVAEILMKEMRLGEGRPLIAESYKEVTILFADLVGFTTLSSNIKASEIIHLLNMLFSKWDRLCAKYNVEKIKTIGDCYMAAVGVPERLIDHAKKAVEFAIEMLQILNQFNKDTNNNLKLRIGINSGSVVAGVIGVVKMQYDVWGDAVNVASRMESSGVENRIQVSHNTFELTRDEFIYEERGSVDIKGKGKMLTYLYKSSKYETKSDGTVVRKSTITPLTSSVIQGISKTSPAESKSEEMKDVFLQKEMEELNM